MALRIFLKIVEYLFDLKIKHELENKNYENADYF